MPLIALLGAPDGEIIGDPKTKELPTLIWQVQDEETKELSVRAYVSTIPGQSAIILVAGERMLIASECHLMRRTECI